MSELALQSQTAEFTEDGFEYIKADLTSLANALGRPTTVTVSGGGELNANLASLASVTMSGTSFVDNVFSVVDNLDVTKKLMFQLSGISPATTRTWTALDSDMVVAGSAVALTTLRVPVVTTGGLLTSYSGLTYTITGSDFTRIQIGDGTAALTPALYLNAATSQQSEVTFRQNDVSRWNVRSSSSADPNFQIIARDNTGALVDTVVTIGNTAGSLFTINRAVSITSTTDSTSNTTGSFITAGGVGIAKALYVGTTANIGSLTATRMVFVGASGRLSDDSNVTWDNTFKTIGVTSNLPVYFSSTAALIRANLVTSNAAGQADWAFTTNAVLRMLVGADNTGGLLDYRGAGSTLTIKSSGSTRITIADTTITVASNIVQTALSGTVDSTSTTTGSLITAGGVGIAKALWVGGLSNFAGAVTASSTIKQTYTLTTVPSVSQAVEIYPTLTPASAGSMDYRALEVRPTFSGANANTSSIISVYSRLLHTATVNLNTHYCYSGLTNVGDAAGSITTWYGAYLQLTNSGGGASAITNGIGARVVGAPAGVTNFTAFVYGTQTTGNWAFYTNSAFNSYFGTGQVSLGSTTDSTSTTTGSLITAGGVGIAKALFVGTTLNVTNVAAIGTTSVPTDKVLNVFTPTSVLTGTINSGVSVSLTSSATATSSGRGVDVIVSTVNSVFTQSELYGVRSGLHTKGASATVTRAAGFSTQTQTVGGTANFGYFHGASLAGSGTWCFYNNASDPVNLGSGWAVLGATARVGSESFRIAGGTAATAGATDILFGAGIIDMGVSLRYRGTQVVGAQAAAIADAAGGATIDTEARTALNDLLAKLRTHGLIAT